MTMMPKQCISEVLWRCSASRNDKLNLDSYLKWNFSQRRVVILTECWHFKVFFLPVKENWNICDESQNLLSRWAINSDLQSLQTAWIVSPKHLFLCSRVESFVSRISRFFFVAMFARNWVMFSSQSLSVHKLCSWWWVKDENNDSWLSVLLLLLLVNCSWGM